MATLCASGGFICSIKSLIFFFNDVFQENTYSIYAGLSGQSEYEILRADEVSDDCNRCCCKPMHPLRLEVRQFIPNPGSVAGVNHVNEDMERDWNQLTGDCPSTPSNQCHERNRRKSTHRRSLSDL